MSDFFMGRLEALRVEMGVPFPLTSAYRSPEHNRAIGGGDQSAHLIGRAVDIRISGAEALSLVVMARQQGFTGIGLRQHGLRATRFVHLDDLDGSQSEQPRPHIWTY